MDEKILKHKILFIFSLSPRSAQLRIHPYTWLPITPDVPPLPATHQQPSISRV